MPWSDVITLHLTADHVPQMILYGHCMRAELSHGRLPCRYLQGLFALAHDSSTEVRKAVCTGLVQMLSLEPDRLQPHMHDIIEYMLASTQVRASPQPCASYAGLLTSMECTFWRGGGSSWIFALLLGRTCIVADSRFLLSSSCAQHGASAPRLVRFDPRLHRPVSTGT